VKFLLVSFESRQNNRKQKKSVADSKRRKTAKSVSRKRQSANVSLLRNERTASGTRP
jgi:hypothetical protein